MMTKVEKSPRFGLLYNWKMIGINHEEPQLYTKKFTYEKTETFRVGLKTAGKNNTSSNPAILFLLTTNLQKMGLQVLSVSFLKREEGNTEGSPWSRWKHMHMKQNDLTTGETAEAAGNQLFTSHLKLDETNLSPTEFKFTVHFINIVDNYRVQQFDGLMSLQLWSSRTDKQEGVDFKLIVNEGESFQVHKWVLAARSPVFAALFSSEEEIGFTHLNLDCMGDEMEQLIAFIYTGHLAGLVSHELMKLSKEYQIKTLEDICQSAFQDAYTLCDDKKAMIAWHMDSESHLTCNEINEPDVEWFPIPSDATIVHHLSIFACTWNVQNLCPKDNQETIKMSVPFEHGGKKLFRAWLEMKKSPNHPEKYTFTALKFLSYGHESVCCNAAQVTCSIDGPDKNSCSHQQIIMTKKAVPKDNKTSLQKFTCLLPAETTPISCPFVITFHAKLESTVHKNICKPLDSTLSGEFWAAAVDRKMTDVEFLVGEEAFGAHRSLLSARSPVFAAMFASGMKEAETGQVRIEDVEPETFQRFLKFLYTGMLESSPRDEKLFTVADKYGVETLMELSRPTNTTGDTVNTFMSC